MARLLTTAIRGYQAFLSPLLTAIVGPQCRFHPSCSHYATEAIEKYGAIKGSWVAARRLIRCQPFCDGGFDPVP